MSELVSLELLKKQVRADDFSDDEEYLQFLLDTAVDAVIASTHRTLEELTDENGNFPNRLALASVMTAAHWYNVRENVANSQMHIVPMTYDYLVKPYRKLEHIEVINENPEL